MSVESVIVKSKPLVHEPTRAIYRGHQSFVGKPRHTAHQGCLILRIIIFQFCFEENVLKTLR